MGIIRGAAASSGSSAGGVTAPTASPGLHYSIWGVTNILPVAEQYTNYTYAVVGFVLPYNISVDAIIHNQRGGGGQTTAIGIYSHTGALIHGDTGIASQQPSGDSGLRRYGFSQATELKANTHYYLRFAMLRAFYGFPLFEPVGSTSDMNQYGLITHMIMMQHPRLLGIREADLFYDVMPPMWRTPDTSDLPSQMDTGALYREAGFHGDNSPYSGIPMLPDLRLRAAA